MLTALCLEVVTATGQSLFHKRYGSDFMDRANMAIETADGNYIVAGTTLGFGSSSNAVIMKLNDQGDPIWTRDYAGINADEIFDLFENDQGQILACGGTNSQGVGNWDGFVMKLDSSGSMLWGRTYGNEYADVLYKIHEDTDGGYIVAGYAQPTDGLGDVGTNLLKLDPMGEVVWNIYVPNGWSTQGGGWYPVDVEIMPDGKYLFTSCSYSNGNQLNFWCFSTTGQLVWAKSYWVRSQGHRLAVDPSGNIYVTCLRLEGGVALSVDVAVLKLDASGNALWFKSYGGTYTEFVRDIVMTSDGSPIICGFTNSSGNGDYDAFLLKIDPAGSAQWCRTYGTVWSDFPNSISATADNGIIMAGESYSYGTDPDSMKMYVVRTDSVGNASCNSSAWPLIQLNDIAGVEIPLELDVLAPQQTAITWASNYRVFTTTSICGATPVGELQNMHVGISAYPNPFHGDLVVTIPEGTRSTVVLRVVDLVGRLVYADGFKNASDGRERTLDLGGLSSGVYVLKALVDERSTSIRIVKE